MTDWELAVKIADAVARAGGGRVYCVGGYARDTVLRRMGHDITSKDIDLEVYGVTIDRLRELLERFGTVNMVGASFGVIKLNGTNIDISIPRRDSKKGVGHKGFMVDTDPYMSIRTAARRRDFTINSLAIDILTGEVTDEYNGVRDLERGVLRATDEQLFVDDPLRVVRAMQLAARFDLRLDAATLSLCRIINLSDLPAERIGEEWRKLLLKAERPSIGLNIAYETGMLGKLHPEFEALMHTTQDPTWHAEGTVWEHVKRAVDVAAGIVRCANLDDVQSLVVMLGVLCHDLGKPSTTRMTNGHITSYGHDTAGEAPARAFLSQLAMPRYYHRVIPSLVVNHMFPTLHKQPSDAAIRRLATRLQPATIAQLVMVSEADVKGRDNPARDTAYLEELLRRSEHLGVAVRSPKPIVRGRDLLDIGIAPGVAMGELLKYLFEKQLAGVFDDIDTGIACAKVYLDNNISGSNPEL